MARRTGRDRSGQRADYAEITSDQSFTSGALSDVSGLAVNFTVEDPARPVEVEFFSGYNLGASGVGLQAVIADASNNILAYTLTPKSIASGGYLGPVLAKADFSVASSYSVKARAAVHGVATTATLKALDSGGNHWKPYLRARYQ